MTSAGAAVTARNESYDGVLSPGASTTFGFQASFIGTISASGLICTANGGTTPTPAPTATPTPGGSCSVSFSAGQVWGDRYNLNATTNGGTNWTVTVHVPSPERISATWNINASWPDSQTMIARPNGNGNNWGMTIMTNGTWTWPTATCTAN